MHKWESAVERQIREAMEQGAFDDLPGKGKPFDFGDTPFEDPLSATMRRIFRDNGVTHPIAEARRALESELGDARAQLRRDGRVEDFASRIRALNREIKLFNLRSPLANFHIHIVDLAKEIEIFQTLRESE